MHFSTMVLWQPFAWTGFRTAPFNLSTLVFFAGVFFCLVVEPMEALINFRFGKNAAIPPSGQLDEPPVFFCACRQA